MTVSFTTDQGIVHYEVFGRGQPVILLHGWLGSWGLWQETMTYLGAITAPMRWIFGDLANRTTSAAPIMCEDFISLVDQFMEQLGIERRRWWGTAWAAR